MSTGIGILNSCCVDSCPTMLQGGRDGMLGHLRTVHHPSASLEGLAEKYRAELKARGLA